MVTLYGGQVTEQQPDSQLHPQFVNVNDEPGPRGPAKRLWFKRPSVTWILCMKTLASLSISIAVGPRLEILTELVCRKYYHERLELSNFVSSSSGAATTTSIFHNNLLILTQAAGNSSIAVGRCTGDPLVQAEVAKVNATFVIISGVLAFLTTGWWGGFMDRYGRTRVIGMTALGPLLLDFLTLVVFFFPDKIPWGYWILVVSPIVEGILGSPSVAETSYMRDVSEPHNLARNFSLLIGIFHAGMTIGPTLGGLLNERTGSATTALFAATMSHLAYAFIAWIALPESVEGASMNHARDQYASELAFAAATDVSPFRRWLLVFSKAFWNSFPLRVLMPRHLMNPRWKKDWNLTLLALSAGLVNVVMASTGDVFQYSLYTFQWSSLQLGYFISAFEFSAAVFLTLILPAIVGVMKRAPFKLQHTGDSRRDSEFDLLLLRVSSLIIATGYALMAFAPTGFIFTLCYVVIALGQGFMPAVQSVAIMLYTGASDQDNAGRLFSALGVVYGLGGRFFGPLLFGTVFSTTVSFFPAAIFWTAVGCSLTVFLLLALVRLPDLPRQDVEQRDSDSLVFCSDRDGLSSESDPLLDRE